jgi:hypothetical protein
MELVSNRKVHPGGMVYSIPSDIQWENAKFFGYSFISLVAENSITSHFSKKCDLNSCNSFFLTVINRLGLQELSKLPFKKNPVFLVTLVEIGRTY